MPYLLCIGVLSTPFLKYLDATLEKLLGNYATYVHVYFCYYIAVQLELCIFIYEIAEDDGSLILDDARVSRSSSQRWSIRLEAIGDAWMA